jgi:hypothetical protein
MCDPTPLHFYPFLQDGTAPLKGCNCSSPVYFPLIPFQLTTNFAHAHPIQLFPAPFFRLLASCQVRWSLYYTETIQDKRQILQGVPFPSSFIP